MVHHLLFHQQLNKRVAIPIKILTSYQEIAIHLPILHFFLFSTLLRNRKFSAMQVCEKDQHYHKLKSGLEYETFGSIGVESEVKLYRED